ncbi:MAG: DNA polymerase III subunit alpha [Patescibacteria group bacterium]|jgi:DNA polymerase-3 subunit alpha
MSDFTHLHVHSHYSLLDGLGTVPKLVDHAKKLNMDTLALTDHGVLYGAVEFSKVAKKAGVKPIIGCELYVAPRTHTEKVSQLDKNPYHLIVLCQNETGYHNLLKLISIAHLDGYYYKPRVDKNLLKQYNEGLICLTACLQGEVARPAGQDDPEKADEALKQYLEIFGHERLFVELQHHPELPAQVLANRHLTSLAQKHQLGLVATNDVHYLEHDDAEAQDALLCIQTGKFMADQNRMSMKQDGRYIDISMLTSDEMSANFADLPEAISNTRKIADMCQFEIKTGQYIFPAFPIPGGAKPDDYLRERCIAGLWAKVVKTNQPSERSEYPSNLDEEYKTRLEYELDVIGKTGFASYMLMVADYNNKAKEMGIFTNTRGSAAGSLVSYLINITDIDPLKYGLIFERFLNQERIDWPDVDLDIADTRRGELIAYVTEKYGADKVAQIITFGTIAAKNSIRDVGRVLGMPYGEVDAVSKLIPLGSTLDIALETNVELKYRYNNEPAIKKLIDLAGKVEGVARHASVHAAGVVISDKDITNYVPVQRIGDKEQSGIVTQFAMKELEAVGLVKMDFLGLANLSIIERALEIIKATRDVDIITAEIPLDDKETYQLLSRGESSGVFQLESDGMKRYLKELKPTVINDIIAMVALYRPGPIELIPDYIAGKHGTKKVTYLHPKLEPILKETYGIAVYQEQILRIARDLCGFSYGEADVLRKAIGKKIKELLLEQRHKWIEKGVQNGITKSLAEKLFDFVEPFARYGFNKAHATSYGMIAYQTAYLKMHYPSQFMAAWLTSEQSRDIEKVSFALNECNRMGIKVLPPDINESFPDFGVVPNDQHKNENIRFGLGAIKNVGHGVAEVIVKERKKNGLFTSLTDFIKRTDGKVINRKTLESLTQAGALDSFSDRNTLFVNIEAILKYATGIHKDHHSQIGLFGSDENEEMVLLNLTPTAPATKQQIMQWEKDLLGIYLSEHPMSDLNSISGHDIIKIGEIKQNMVDKSVRIIGMITSVKSIITKSNQAMAFVKVEDATTNIELIIFPNLYAETKDLWQNDRIIVADGKVNDKDGSLKILVNAAWDITEARSVDGIDLPALTSYKNGNGKSQNGRAAAPTTGASEKPVQMFPESAILHITIPEDTSTKTLSELKHVLSLHNGVNAFILHLPDQKEIKPRLTVKIDFSLLDQIARLVGPHQTEVR